MARRVARTVLVFHRALLGSVAVTIGVIAAAAFALFRAYRFVPASLATLIEGVVAALCVLVVAILWFTVRAVARTGRLERELRRGRGESGVIETSLAVAVRQYTQDLQRSQVIRTGRIQVQRRLIETILHNVDRPVFVLSGTGGLLYRSVGSFETEDDATVSVSSDGSDVANEGDFVHFSPPGEALAAHLLAGKGPGTVLVNDKTMYFSGIYGDIVAADETRSRPTLAYIVISDRAITPVQPVASTGGGGAARQTAWHHRLRGAWDRVFHRSRDNE